MRSILHHITPLVINNLARGDAHTHTHTNDPRRIKFKKPGVPGRCTPGLKTTHMIGFGKLTKISHQAYAISLTQLMATLIHYPFTVVLPGLADWFS